MQEPISRAPGEPQQFGEKTYLQEAFSSNFPERLMTLGVLWDNWAHRLGQLYSRFFLCVPGKGRSSELSQIFCVFYVYNAFLVFEYFRLLLIW